MPTRFPQILLGAALLPWREDFTLDELQFREHIRSIIRHGFQHIYLMGTAGEGYALTDRQFQQVVQVFWEEMQQPDLHPMVGVISLSTQLASPWMPPSRRRAISESAEQTVTS